MYAFLFIFSHIPFLCVEASLQILKDPSLSMHITKGDPKGCSKLCTHKLLTSSLARFSTGHCQQHVDHSTVWFHCAKEHRLSDSSLPLPATVSFREQVEGNTHPPSSTSPYSLLLTLEFSSHHTLWLHFSNSPSHPLWGSEGRMSLLEQRQRLGDSELDISWSHSHLQ